MNQPWLMVADAAEAQFYVFHGHFNQMKPLQDGHFKHTHAKSQDLVTTKKGRVNHSHGDSRSALERPTDPHEHEKKVFARSLIEHIKQHHDDIASIVIVAPPKMLGYLRDNMDKTTKSKVVASLAKDLTGESDDKIAELLAKDVDKQTRASNQLKVLNS